MRFIYLFIAIIAFPFAALSQNDEKLTPPKAAIIPHFDTTHQDIRQDNYFWLRKKDSPEVINHLYAENGFADLTHCCLRCLVRFTAFKIWLARSIRPECLH